MNDSSRLDGENNLNLRKPFIKEQKPPHWLKCLKKSDDGLKMQSNSSKPRFPRSRIIWFLSVFSTTPLAATWLVCATCDHFWQTASMPVWQIIFPALTLIFVATTILGRRYSNLWLRLGYRISAIWLGVLNYSFFAAAAAQNLKLS